MSKIIGYDLDGVIISDVKIGKITDETLKELHILRSKLYPIFYPKGDFVIITGRPEVDREQTINWLNSYNINPKKLHMIEMINGSYEYGDVIKHKSKWINHYGDEMESFVESDIVQVSEIIKNVKIPVYHFGSVISGVFSCK